MMESPPTRQTFGDAEIDLSNLKLTVDGVARELEPKSFRLLAFLIENRRRVVPKDEILKVVWEGVAVSDNALTRAIAQVRKSLDDDPKQPRYIETIPTVGYRFIADVAEAAPNAPRPPTTEILPRAPHRRLLAWGVAAAALVAAGLGAVRFFGWGQRGPFTPEPVALTTYPGSEYDPTFSPDGSQVAFTWGGPQDDNADIYVKAIGSEAPLRLTMDPAPDVRPAWSPDGRVIAFQRKLPGQRFAVMLVPPLGGPERKLAEFPAYWTLPGGAEVGTGLSWSPDGKWLAVSGDTLLNSSNRILLVFAETGEVRPLTQPPSKAWSDYNPAFSPDGREMLFTRSSGMGSGNLYRLALGPGFSPRGDPEKIPTVGVGYPMSAAWAGSGKEILFVSQALGELYRMLVAGTRPPEKLPLGGEVRSFALSADGRRLAYSVMLTDANIWRLDLKAKGASPERFISSTQRDTSPFYSPDGRRIAFSSNRSGSYQIWTCDADGSKPGVITSIKKQGGSVGPRWSPDGRTFLFDSTASGHYEVYTVGVDGGKVNQITHGDAAQFGGTWSRDGRWIYYASTAEGEPQIWKIPSQGGAPVRVTHNGGLVAKESPDGKSLYYAKQPGRGSLWKVPLAGGPEEMISDSIYRFNYAVIESGVYVMRNGGIDFIDSATGKSRNILRVRNPDLGLDLSPDGRYLLYAQVDSGGTDLMLLDGFR